MLPKLITTGLVFSIGILISPNARSVEFKEVVNAFVDKVCAPYLAFHKDIHYLWDQFPHDSFNFRDSPKTSYPLHAFHTYRDESGHFVYRLLDAVLVEQMPVRLPSNINEDITPDHFGLRNFVAVQAVGEQPKGTYSEERILFVATVAPLFVMTAFIDVDDSLRPQRSSHDVTLKFPTYEVHRGDRYGFPRQLYRFTDSNGDHIGFRQEAQFSSLIPGLDADSFTVTTKLGSRISSVEICTNMPFIPLYIENKKTGDYYDGYLEHIKCATNDQYHLIKLDSNGGSDQCSG